MITWLAVVLLIGGMLGMLLMAILVSFSDSDDVRELQAKVDFCETHHPARRRIGTRPKVDW